MIVLAAPYGEAVSDLNAVGDLTNKVVIDITNPLTPDYMKLTIGHSTSVAPHLAGTLIRKSPLACSRSHMMYAIHITNTGEHFPCAPTQNLLAGMEALARTGIPVGCRGGGCGVCKVHIESGQVRSEKMSRARLSIEDQRQGFVLACCSYPTSHLTVRAVDRLARCIEHGVDRQRAVSFLDAARASATRPSPARATNHPSEESPWR